MVISSAIAKFLGRRLELLLFTRTSIGSVRELALASSKRQALRPVSSSHAPRVNKYCNPRACAPRVNKTLFTLYTIIQGGARVMYRV